MAKKKGGEEEPSERYYMTKTKKDDAPHQCGKSNDDDDDATAKHAKNGGIKDTRADGLMGMPKNKSKNHAQQLIGIT